jgi:hypothetical protein
MASEIWSDTLSGWPSETDSEVKKKSFDMVSLHKQKRLIAAARPALRRERATL